MNSIFVNIIFCFQQLLQAFMVFVKNFQLSLCFHSWLIAAYDWVFVSILPGLIAGYYHWQEGFIIICMIPNDMLHFFYFCINSVRMNLAVIQCIPNFSLIFFWNGDFSETGISVKCLTNNVDSLCSTCLLMTIPFWTSIVIVFIRFLTTSKILELHIPLRVAESP